MLIKGVYTSVWNNAICLTANVDVDTATHTFQFVTLPFCEALQEIDPSGNTQKDFPACRKDALSSKTHTEMYFTYIVTGELI